MSGHRHNWHAVPGKWSHCMGCDTWVHNGNSDENVVPIYTTYGSTRLDDIIKATLHHKTEQEKRDAVKELIAAELAMYKRHIYAGILSEVQTYAYNIVTGTKEDAVPVKAINKLFMEGEK